MFHRVLGRRVAIRIKRLLSMVGNFLIQSALNQEYFVARQLRRFNGGGTAGVPKHFMQKMKGEIHYG
jgi:hypothetical protein